MRKENGYYLSEATREVEFEYGYFNSIIAPVGSGKTTYVGSKLPQEIEDDGLYIYLAPYTMLRDQVLEEGLFDEMTEKQELTMQGFVFFDDNYNAEDMLDLKGVKVAMTPHKFFKMALAYPLLMDRVSLLVIDESDHVFCRLPHWEKDDKDKIFERATSLIMTHLDSVLTIGITATGEGNLSDLFGSFYNSITFKEELRRYKHKLETEYSDVKLAFSDAKKYDGKVAIFTESVRNMIKQREYLESIGYSVDMIVSDYAKNYKMNDREKQIKDELAKTGKSDLIGDVLLFNSAMERGVSIHDKSFTTIIIHSSNEDVQTQVLGRFRFDGMRVWKLLPDYLRDRKENYTISKTGEVSSGLDIPVEYLGIPLTSDMKSELIEDIGFSKAWVSLKKELIENGYKVEDSRIRIDGKITRVSTIIK